MKSKFWASGAGTGKVFEFEKKFKKYVNSKNCIAVNSGTAALNLALSIYDIKNKEVILPSLTFVATANAVIMNGGKPVFVDVDPYTLNIDTEKIENSITEKTKVLLPVHFGGLSCNIDKINSIAKKYNLKIIEPDGKFVKKLRLFKPDVVLNLLHGRYGEDGYIQSILESEKIKIYKKIILAFLQIFLVVLQGQLYS